jgi:hypothetical protein
MRIIYASGQCGRGTGAGVCYGMNRVNIDPQMDLKDGIGACGIYSAAGNG